VSHGRARTIIRSREFMYLVPKPRVPTMAVWGNGIIRSSDHLWLPPLPTVRGRVAVFSGMKAWLARAPRPLPAVVVAPVLVGSASAWFETGRFDALAFVLALVGVALVHFGANMSNDYFDYLSENDAREHRRHRLQRGSRVIQEGLIAARSVQIASIRLSRGGTLIGLCLVLRLGNNPAPRAGVRGCLPGVLLTASPLRLGYHGLGELLTGLCFGPLTAVGSALVQMAGSPRSPSLPPFRPASWWQPFFTDQRVPGSRS